MISDKLSVLPEVDAFCFSAFELRNKLEQVSMGFVCNLIEMLKTTSFPSIVEKHPYLQFFEFSDLATEKCDFFYIFGISQFVSFFAIDLFEL